VLVRVPLVVNAHDHLDSDLAVDGLTLVEAVNGHWRWHFPGTPYMGILPILGSLPQALIWGAGPETLASGGTVLWLSVVIATFVLAKRTYGIDVAAWSIIPLVFSSLGTIWLSGRITGGHLLALTWHLGAFWCFYECLVRGGAARAAVLGLWCGLGLYLDLMFAFTLAGMAPAAVWAWLLNGRPRAAFRLAAICLAAALIGLIPREIGRRVDPYDAYPAQFAPTFEPTAIVEHARLLGLHCLPRLIAGTEIGDSETNGPGSTNRAVWPAIDEGLPALFLLAFSLAVIRLGWDLRAPEDSARRALSLGILSSAILIVVAFLVNRNIFNSDNYRYLIFLLAPWSLGFGLLMADLVSQGRTGRVAACSVAVLFFVVMTATTFLWYRDDRHYVDKLGLPVRLKQAEWSQLRIVGDTARGGPGRTFSFEVPANVSHVFGGYWDVYRMAFLSGGRLVGIPYPMYPNRYQGWSHGLGPGYGNLLVLLPELPGKRVRSTAATERRGRLAGSASGINWRAPLETSWKLDGRDPAELNQLQVVVP
jgi:hypothetical protein